MLLFLDCFSIHQPHLHRKRRNYVAQNGFILFTLDKGHFGISTNYLLLFNYVPRDHVVVHLGINVNSSAHNCGCVVDGCNAMAAILSIIIITMYK